MKVLLVDDDRELVDMLVFAFGRAGLTTTTAHDVASGLARFEQDQPDLMVLDLHLGGSNGFDLLRQVRDRSQVPIIILSALDSDDDKVKGLSLGADDYVTKPFSHRELLTRILMRLRRPGQAAPRPLPNVLRVADIELDASAHTVQRGGQPVNLTVTEFRLLHHLLVNAGQVVSTEDILRHVWGNPDPTDSDVLRVTLHRLRRKLGETGSQQGLLRTVPGVGVLLQGERLAPVEATPREDEATAPPSPAVEPAASAPRPEAIPEPATPAVPPAAPTAPPAASEPAPTRPARAPAVPPQRGGRVERDGQDRLRLRFHPDAEVESVLFTTPAATLERYDPDTGEVTWTMPARGERTWDVFDVARRRGFTFATDIDVPAPSAGGGAAVLAAPASAPAAAAPAEAAPEPSAPAPAEPGIRPAGTSAVGALARAGADRAADGLSRAAGLAAAAGARARAARARPEAAAAAGPAAVPGRPRLAVVPAVPGEVTAPRKPLTLSEAAARISGSGQTAAMLITVSMIAAALSIWAESVRIGLLSELERVGTIPLNVYEQAEARGFLLALMLLVLYAASAVAFLAWINRSYARLRARGITGLRYTPVTAVMWFLVPVAFLFMPRRVVSDLWHAAPLADGARAERRRRVPLIVSSWWTVFVAFAIAAALTGATPAEPNLRELYRQAWTNIASDVLAIAAGLLAVTVIVMIDLRQPPPERPAK